MCLSYRPKHILPPWICTSVDIGSSIFISHSCSFCINVLCTHLCVTFTRVNSLMWLLHVVKAPFGLCVSERLRRPVLLSRSDSFKVRLTYKEERSSLWGSYETSFCPYDVHCVTWSITLHHMIQTLLSMVIHSLSCDIILLFVWVIGYCVLQAAHTTTTTTTTTKIFACICVWELHGKNLC